MNPEPERPRRPAPGARGCRAITMVEALVVLVLVTLLGMFLLASVARPRTPTQSLQCVRNLKQTGLAFRLFATDNSDRFPQCLSTNEGGTREFGADLAAHFRVLSNELAASKVVTCPADARGPAASFDALTSANISYFLGMEADELLPEMVLAGDGNLSTNSRPVRPGWLYPAANLAVGWFTNRHAAGGNLAFSDGSAQQLTGARLDALLSVAPNLTNRFLVP